MIQQVQKLISNVLAPERGNLESTKQEEVFDIQHELQLQQSRKTNTQSSINNQKTRQKTRNSTFMIQRLQKLIQIFHQRLGRRENTNHEVFGISAVVVKENKQKYQVQFALRVRRGARNRLVDRMSGGMSHDEGFHGGSGERFMQRCSRDSRT